MKRRQHNTSKRIAEATLRLLEKEGAEAVSMRRVAKAVGITPMAIYSHFPNREALLKMVTDNEFRKLLQFSGRRLRAGRLDSLLVNILDGYLDYALAHPNVFDYVFSKPRPDARRFPKDFRARRSPTLNLIADAIAEEMKKGALRKDDIWEVAMALWTQAHGCVTLYRAQRFALSKAQFRAFYRRSLRRLLKGLEA
jgi:AcrR family transcriptional regulator